MVKNRIILGKLIQQLTAAKFLMRILMTDINHNSKVHFKYLAIVFLTMNNRLYLKTGLFLLEQLQAQSQPFAYSRSVHSNIKCKNNALWSPYRIAGSSI